MRVRPIHGLWVAFCLAGCASRTSVTDSVLGAEVRVTLRMDWQQRGSFPGTNIERIDGILVEADDQWLSVADPDTEARRTTLIPREAVLAIYVIK